MANFYGELVIRITSDTTGLKKGLTESAAATRAMNDTVGKNSRLAAQRMEHVGRQMQNVGRQMTQFVTLPVAAGFAVAGVAAYKFEDALIKVKNLTGLTAAETKKYGDAMLAMGGEVGKTPLQLADAFYFLASSGFKGKEAMDALNVAAKASSAGLGDVMATADVVSSAVNAYGHENLTAAHMVDVLMKTIEVGKAEPEQLAASLGRIMPVAQGLAIPIEDLGGMIAGLTLTGLSSAEAVTALRGAMMALSAPTKMSIEAYKEMDLTYKQVTERIAKNGLIETLQFLYERVDGDRLAMRKLIPNVRALNGVLSLLGPNYQKNLQVIDQVNHAQGKLNETFASTKETNVFKIRKAWAELQASAIKIGGVILPYFAQFMEWLTRLAEKFNGLSDSTKKFILQAAATAAVLGPVVMVVGTLVNAIGLLRGVIAGVNFAKFIGGLKAIGGVMGNLGTGGSGFLAALKGIGPLLAGNPFMIAVAAMGAMAVGAGILISRYGEVAERIRNMNRAVELVAKDDKLKEWADRNLGGHLEEVMGQTTFISATLVPTVDSSALVGGVKTANAKARAQQMIEDKKTLLQIAQGQKDFFAQRVSRLEGMQTGMEAQGKGDVFERQFGQQFADAKAQLAEYTDEVLKLGAAVDRTKEKGSRIVVRTQIQEQKGKIKTLEGQLDRLHKRPWSVKVALKEAELMRKLGKARADLKDFVNDNYSVTIEIRTERVKSKLQNAKDALFKLVGGGERGKVYSAEVQGKIDKLTSVIATGEKELQALEDTETMPVINANIDPATAGISIVNSQLNALASRTTTTTIYAKTIPMKGVPVGKDAWGGYYTKPRLTLVGEDGPELILPLSKPRRMAQLVEQSGLSKMLPPTPVPARSTPQFAAPARGGGEVHHHYHSSVSIPGGTIVDQPQKLADRLAPYQAANMRTAKRRRQRGQATL